MICLAARAWALGKSRTLANRTKGHCVQGVLQGHGGLVPNIKCSFASRGFAVNARQGYSPFNGVNNVRKGYGVRGTGKHMPTSNTAHAFDNAFSLQQTHDLLHKFFRDACTCRKL